MGKLGQYCQENGRRHGYCTDHNFHRNAILAFDRKSVFTLFHTILIDLLVFFLTLNLHELMITAKNVPVVASAMKKMKAMNSYFESSSQAMGELLDFQRTTEIEEYKEQGEPKKTIQDVCTRWWSTYRSMRRLRFLKKAIKSLIASELINCVDLTNDEWIVLHQVEITLETMADYQRMLEGECYVTGSMVVVAVCQIRKSYMDVIECEHTNDAVVRLTRILLKDFNNRYVPSEGGRVKYLRDDDIGRGNRYVGVHQYFFFASFFDPRVLPMLSDIITDDDFEMVKNDLIHLMVTKTKVKRNYKELCNEESCYNQASASPFVVETHTTQTISKQTRKLKHMFLGLKTNPQILKQSTMSVETDDKVLRDDC
jgi:hypothetical protein